MGWSHNGSAPMAPAKPAAEPVRVSEPIEMFEAPVPWYVDFDGTRVEMYREAKARGLDVAGIYKMTLDDMRAEIARRSA